MRLLLFFFLDNLGKGLTDGLSTTTHTHTLVVHLRERTSHGHIGFFCEGQYDKLMISNGFFSLSVFLYSSSPWETLARLWCFVIPQLMLLILFLPLLSFFFFFFLFSVIFRWPLAPGATRLFKRREDNGVEINVFCSHQELFFSLSRTISRPICWSADAKAVS